MEILQRWSLWVKNLKKHVACSICLETYTNPKMIACLHTFCCHCLEWHARTSTRNGEFRCLECQAEIMTHRDEYRFDKLPTRFHHNSLLSVLCVRQVGDGSKISCGICKKTSVEISYCLGCEKLMCSDCKNAQDLFKNAAFQGHKVTPVKQFQDKDYEAMLKRQSFCSQQYHEREPTRFFCAECKMCVCQICINTTHKIHGVEPLEKVAEKRDSNASWDDGRKNPNLRCFNSTDWRNGGRDGGNRCFLKVADQILTKARDLKSDNITVLEPTPLLSAERFNSAKERSKKVEKTIVRPY